MKLSNTLALAFLASLGCFGLACGDASPGTGTADGTSFQTSSPAQPTSPPKAAATTATARTAQELAGEKLFASKCVECHGASVTIASFANAADMADFVEQNMPRNAPGTLSESETFAIVAFDIAEHGIDLHGETLDATNARSISLR